MLNEVSSSRRACRNKTDVFCYNCGIVPNRNPVTKFIKRAYHTYFGTKLGDQYKAWAPHMVCKTCTKYLRRWTNGKKGCLKFGIPMVWSELANHDLNEINRKNRTASSILIFYQHVVLQLIVMKFQYLSLENFLTSARKPPRVLKRMKRK